MPELTQIEKVVFLQSAHLFAFCKAEQVLRIASIATERSVESGVTIIEANQPAECLHCIVRGTVELRGPSGVSEALPLQTLDIRDVLTGRLRTVGAVAQTDTLLLSIDVEDFFDLLANDIEIVKALFRQFLSEAK
ncbi:MAG: cyclic nucleotide-binding domain-containing protein [Acidobacteriota bacterium]|nr:cyclic nucleotide-binding domain-containing protein [Acidobacteriota bacterium]MDH3785791.1 cyclic nucleotide-binding domain-containing protein [Acidobacteriota bacterium]